MKHRHILALAALAGLGGVTTLHSASLAAEVDCRAVTDYASLAYCLEAAQDITLQSDVQFPKATSSLAYNAPGESITLDLGSHSILGHASGFGRSVLEVLAGDITIENGSIGSTTLPSTSLAVRSLAGRDDTSYTVVRIRDNVQLLSSDGYGIQIMDDSKHSYSAFVDFSGHITAKTGIYVEEDIQNHENYPSIHIGSTATITATGAHAIVAGGYAGWNIDAAHLTGQSGLGIKSGKFYINGAQVHATGANTTPRPMAADMRNTGAALQLEVVSGATDESEFYIESGQFISDHGYAIVEYPFDTSAEDISLMSFRVNTGEFVGTYDFDDSVIATSTGAFIWYFGDGQMLEDGSMFLETMDAYDSHKMTIAKYASSVTGFDAMLTDPRYSDVERIVPVFTPLGTLDPYDEESLLEAGYDDAEVLDVYDLSPRAFLYDMGTPEPHMSRIYSLVTSTGDYPITFTMDIPDVPELPSGYQREYFVLNFHMDLRTGEYDIIRLPVILSEDDTSYSFSTNRFSTFALAYRDILIPTVPDTGIPD